MRIYIYIKLIYMYDINIIQTITLYIMYLIDYILIYIYIVSTNQIICIPISYTLNHTINNYNKILIIMK